MAPHETPIYNVPAHARHICRACGLRFEPGRKAHRDWFLHMLRVHNHAHVPRECKAECGGRARPSEGRN